MDEEALVFIPPKNEIRKAVSAATISSSTHAGTELCVLVERLFAARVKDAGIDAKVDTHGAMSKLVKLSRNLRPIVPGQ